MQTKHMQGFDNRIVGHADVPVSDILFNPRNWRIHPKAQKEALKGTISDVGYIRSVTVNRVTGHLIDGHLRVLLADEMGQETIPVEFVELSEAEEAEALATFDPLGAMAAADKGKLDELLRDVQSGEAAVQAMLAELAEREGIIPTEGQEGQNAAQARQTLAERFIVPPFSVLDARQGYWQERKRAWIALGLKAELGRNDNILDGGHSDQSINIDFYARKRALEAELGRQLSTDEARNILVQRGEIRHVDRSKAGRGRVKGQTYANGDAVGGAGGFVGQMVANMGNGRPQGAERQPPAGKYEYPVGQLQEANGTSIMDPVLCECAYRWFCPPKGLVVNPMAGESSYGIVAAYLGYRYKGVELRPEQVEANRKQAEDIGVPAEWIEGDGRNVGKLVNEPADFIMSCPPYADLEVYSDNPLDLSTLEYDEFIAAYRDIIAKSVALLKPNRFACFVVGDIRDKRGLYRNFVGDTVTAFAAAGLALYNEAILVTAVGSLPIRAGKQFSAGRKLGKTHQNVLVFVKGDWRQAVKDCGEVDVSVPEGFGDAD